MRNQALAAEQKAKRAERAAAKKRDAAAMDGGEEPPAKPAPAKRGKKAAKGKTPSAEAEAVALTGEDDAGKAGDLGAGEMAMAEAADPQGKGKAPAGSLLSLIQKTEGNVKGALLYRQGMR